MSENNLDCLEVDISGYEDNVKNMEQREFVAKLVDKKLSTDTKIIGKFRNTWEHKLCDYYVVRIDECKVTVLFPLFNYYLKNSKYFYKPKKIEFSSSLMKKCRSCKIKSHSVRLLSCSSVDYFCQSCFNNQTITRSNYS
jgi:hypothetical protein